MGKTIPACDKYFALLTSIASLENEDHPHIGEGMRIHLQRCSKREISAVWSLIFGLGGPDPDSDSDRRRQDDATLRRMVAFFVPVVHMDSPACGSAISSRKKNNRRQKEKAASGSHTRVVSPTAQQRVTAFLIKHTHLKKK